MGRPFQGGSLTRKGYLRTKQSQNGKSRMVHDLVWEAEHGPIPKGMNVHHKDENKRNNDISNLELINPLNHKRIHSGAFLEKGVWKWKCRKCGEIKDIDTYYKVFDKKMKKHYPMQPCRQCCIARAIKNKKK